MFKQATFQVLAVMLLSMLFSTSFAGQKQINLQGKLTDPTNGNAPITGSHTLYFRLYSVPTAGSVLWSENHQVVLPSNGVFNVILGSTQTLDSIAFNKPYYVGIAVDGTTEMTPRQPLVATPYSFGSIGDMNIGKNLYVVGNSSVSCSLFVSSNVAVSGNMNLSSDLNVSGKTNIGALYVSSNVVVSGNAVIQGSATINGNTFFAGSVGIGRITNHPYAALDVDGRIYTSDSGSVCTYTLSTNHIASYTGGRHLEIMHAGYGFGDIIFGTDQKTERMRITNAGNVGIGTIPVYSLDVAGPGTPTVNIQGTSGRLYVNNIGCNTGQYLSILVKTKVTKLLIDTDNDDSAYKLYVNGDAYCSKGFWSGSDVTFKRDIRPLADNDVVNKVSRLQAIKYKFDKSKMMQINKGAEDQDDKGRNLEKEAKEIGISAAELKKRKEEEAYAYCDDEQIGLSAQELEKEFPELVHADKNGYKAVNYDGLTVILIEALKKQQSTINDLEMRVRNLESVKK